MSVRPGGRPLLFALALVLSGGLPAGPLAAQAEGERAGPVIRVAPDAPAGAPREGRGTDRPSNLQETLAGLEGPARVRLDPGHYHLRARSYGEPACGNCEDPNTPVRATVGLRVSGRGIELAGASPGDVVIHTNAGYGILFDGCRGCSLRGVTVTGGVRDPDGNATDAGVVVKESHVEVSDCVIRDNVGDSATVADVVVGIAGIVGRRGADLRIRGCRILGNSWDGIALYRDAEATIEENLVDGVDRASGGHVGGGRGVGIGLTWNARARVTGNLVRRYWKGIGIFVDASATLRHNVVEEVLTWGIAYWDAGKGSPVATVEENAVFRTGACGVMLAASRRNAEDPGGLIGNAVVEACRNEAYDGGQPYCTQRPLAREAVPDGFRIRGNLFHGSRQPGESAPIEQLDRDEFVAAARPLLRILAARPTLRASSFLREFDAGRDG